jgi:hypothetical protein
VKGVARPYANRPNDGKADRMIMATKLLNQRIKDVMCARKRAGKASSLIEALSV